MNTNDFRRSTFIRNIIVGLVVAVGVGHLQSDARAIWPFDTGAKAPAARVSGPVRVYRLSGSVSERARPFDLFGSNNGNVLGDLLQQIAADIADPQTKLLLFKVRAFAPASAQAEEIARRIQAARKAGKTVEVHLESLDLPNLLAFGGADSLSLVPEGSALIAGLRAEVAFYRDLMAKIGIEADFEAVGDFKSAGESFTRDSMSDAARENLDALLDDLWKTLREDIAGARKLSLKQLDAAIDKGMLDAEACVKAKLVDQVATWSERLAAAEKRFGTPTVAWPKRDETPEIGSLLDLLKLFGDKDEKAAPSRPAIAVIAAQGPIVEGRAASDWLESDTVIAVEDLLDDLHTASENPLVKAIVLRIDSPGGSALASDLIWQELTRIAAKRPLIVSLGPVAASGGYYIASAGHKIFADATTLTGSIGVFGGKLVHRELLSKVGVQTTVIGRGKNNGLMSGLDRFNSDERAAFRGQLERTYRTFVNRVARGRNMGFDAVERLAKGRVWTGRQALERGLVDAIGGLDEAVAEAFRKAQLDPAESDIVRLPKAGGFMDLLTNDRTSPRIELGTGQTPWLAALPPAIAAPIRDAVRLLTRLFEGQNTLMMMPFTLQLK